MLKWYSVFFRILFILLHFKKYQINHIFLSVTESVLAFDDIPWEVLKRRGHESVRLMELTRFYIQLVKDPHGPDVGLFIGNLPVNLSQRKYENIINEFLDDSTWLCRCD